jgi:hypothetical protein
MGTLVNMTIIPNFILKRMYREGSFRRLEGGVGFDIVNNLGPGQLSRINGITLNGTTYEASQIELIWNEERLPAEAITETEPATFFLNQVITCVIRDEAIAEGAYQITLDLISREAGKVVLTVKDTLKAA